MTLKIMIVNSPENPTDHVVEVERIPSGDPKRNLWPGQSMEGYIYEGAEYHIREAAIPPPEPPEVWPQPKALEETKPQEG